MDQQQFNASVNAIIRHKVAQGQAESAIEDARMFSDLSPERTHAGFAQRASTRPFPLIMRCWRCSGRGWLRDTEQRRGEPQTCFVCSGTGTATYEGRA